ncbi:MAG: hypothetical protein ACT4R6_08780, partial [Gemmatimonadaceae bacterium]
MQRLTRTILRPLLVAGAALAGAACGTSDGPTVDAGKPNAKTGSLTVDIAGLPNEAAPAAPVTIQGPGGFFSRSIAATTTVTGLTPGSYSVAAADVSTTTAMHSASPAAQNVEVSAGTTASVSVAYGLATGMLELSLSGLPAGTPGALTVTGPNGYARVVTASETLMKLTPGTYSVSAASVTAGGETYAATSPAGSVDVTPSPTPVAVSVTYAVLPGTGQINLTIDNVYITQSVQTYVSDVPLVAGRDGLVRVFVKASGPNSAQPQVRVRLYDGPTLVNTLTLNASAAAVPTTIEEGSLAASWNAAISGALVRPGLRLLADVDPGNAVAESSETDNAWPGPGEPATMYVLNVPTFAVRFVPIKQKNDLTGNVTANNVAAFLHDLRRMFPLGAVDADVRSTYTSNSGALEPNDANNAWTAVLSEINTLRTMDGSSRYYYGVVRTSYGSGVAGLGYLGGRAAVGWDFLPSGREVMAHEVGHNWGRYHSPCGGAGSPDPSFPYPGGAIGATGYDLTSAVLKPPSVPDLMGYCLNAWISDYTYKGIQSYRQQNAMAAAARAAAPQPGLLVWGRIQTDTLVLEPSFEVVAQPSLPSRSGPHHITGLADDGSQVFSFAFEGDALDHGSARDRHFSFVIPLRQLRGRPLAALRLTSDGRHAELRSTAATVAALGRSEGGAPLVMRAANGTMRVQWSDPAVRGVLVRDPLTGDVLTIARGG